MKLDDDKKGIIWSADDPNEHSFEMNVTRPTEDNPNPDKVTQTIESYYREKYGILLKYPKVSYLKHSLKYYFDQTFCTLLIFFSSFPKCIF